MFLHGYIPLRELKLGETAFPNAHNRNVITGKKDMWMGDRYSKMRRLVYDITIPITGLGNTKHGGQSRDQNSQDRV